MADKYPVVLVFIDEQDNHKDALPQIGKDMYLDVINFTTFIDFKNFMDNPSNKDMSILLFIHVFRTEELKGYTSANKKMIKREFPNLVIHWVTSDKPGETSDRIKEPHNTYKYDEISDYIDSGALLPTKISEAKDSNTKLLTMKKNYIFISHSSKDKVIVNSFFENIIRLGLDISKNDVFYSSHPSTGISTGEDIPDSIKDALNKMTLFIQYISDDYKASEVCLNEMGAAWIKLPKNRIITLKAPNLGFSDLGFLNIQRIGLCIEKKEDLLAITRDYKDLFDFDPADYNEKIHKFIKENGLLPAH